MIVTEYKFAATDEIYSLVSQLLNNDFFVYKNYNQVK